MISFEFVEKYKDCGLALPVRKTAYSAGYDFQVAEDTLVPPYASLYDEMYADCMSRGVIFRNERGWDQLEPQTLEEVARMTKAADTKPILVPTGVKCHLDEHTYLELSVRSSAPLKHWLILANGVGIIDADYYNNPDNEGHIFFQVINLSPVPIILKKGDTIGQGIIKFYLTTSSDDASGERLGGFGSTD